LRVKRNSTVLFKTWPEFGELPACVLTGSAPDRSKARTATLRARISPMFGRAVQSNCCYAISLLSRQRTRAGVSCRCCIRPTRTGHRGGERARHLRLGRADGAKRP